MLSRWHYVKTQQNTHVDTDFDVLKYIIKKFNTSTLVYLMLSRWHYVKTQQSIWTVTKIEKNSLLHLILPVLPCDLDFVADMVYCVAGIPFDRQSRVGTSWGPCWIYYSVIVLLMFSSIVFWEVKHWNLGHTIFVPL